MHFLCIFRGLRFGSLTRTLSIPAVFHLALGPRNAAYGRCVVCRAERTADREAGGALHGHSEQQRQRRRGGARALRVRQRVAGERARGGVGRRL